MKSSRYFFVSFLFLVFPFSALYGGLNYERAEVELCDYHRPSVQWAVLPVFPEDPLSVGDKCVPVYDVMLDPSGKAILAQPVSSPGKSFDVSFTKMLQFRKYEPATEKANPVVSMFRDVSFSYFYLKRDSESEEITTLPQSIWAMESNLYLIGFYMHSKIQIEVDLDKEGRVVELRSLDLISHEAKRILYKGRFKKKLFIPAYAGEVPVKCTLIHVMGEQMTIPQQVKDKILCNEENLFQEKSSVSENAQPLKLKVCYDQDGFVSSIVTEDLAAADLRKLWVAMSQVRLYKAEVEDSSDEIMYHKSIYEDRVIFDSEKDKPAILSCEKIPFVFPEIVRRENPMFSFSSRMPELVDVGVMNFSVDEVGDVIDADLILCDDKWLNKNAKNALMKWEFKPALYEGNAVPSIYRITFDINW